MKKKINFLFIYVSFFTLPIILILSQKNIALITSTHLKYFIGSQLIILVILSIVSYLIFKFFFPLIKIKVRLKSFLIVNSFFLFLTFYYRPILFYFFPGDYNAQLNQHTQTSLNHFIIILGYLIFYTTFFYFYLKGKKLINIFLVFFISINFFIFIIYFGKFNHHFDYSKKLLDKFKFINQESKSDLNVESKTQSIKINKTDNSSSKTEIFFIIFDGMLSLDYAEKINIVNKDHHIKQLNSNGFTYVKNFSSNYIPTYLSLASVLRSDFPVTDKSEKYINHSNFFPNFMLSSKTENNFINIISKLKYKFIWTGNSHIDCTPNNYSYCFTKDFTKDYLTKLRLLYYDSIFVYILDRYIFRILNNQIDAEKFLSDFDIHDDLINLVENKSIYLIHVLKPHPPFEFDKNCNKLSTTLNHQPNREEDNYLENYKIAYNCVLKIINNWISKKSINKDDTITFIFGDHGWHFDKKTMKKVKDEYNLNELDFRLSPYFAYQIPQRCNNLNVPKSLVNLMRFALNCAENQEYEFLEDKMYIDFSPSHKNYGYVKEYK